MNVLLSFLLAGTTIASPADDQALKPRVEISGQIYMPDGKTTGASRRFDLGAEPAVWYVYTGKTLCEAQTVSAEKPIVAGNGWRLELSGSPASGAKGVSTVKAAWQRLWEDGKPLANGKAGNATLTLRPGSAVPLDTIDGGGRKLSFDGCSALSMNLQIQSVESTTEGPVFEINYWLVHRDPAGKETTQHQVVRTKAPNGADFFFNDVKVETERGPVTVEVFGGSGSPWVNANGTTGLNIGVRRRYNTTSSGYGWKTKEGESSYGCAFGRDEVLAFQLPPLPGDDGALVGHRFSVRVRMRVLP